jgi:hypothetical protein
VPGAVITVRGHFESRDGGFPESENPKEPNAVVEERIDLTSEREE